MNRQNMVDTYKEIFNLLKRKEILTNSTTQMNLEDIMKGKISSHKKTNPV